MGNLGTAYREAGMLDLALPLLEETVKRCTAKLGADHPHTLTSMANLAAGYQDLKDLKRALPLLEDTHRRTVKKHGPDHPQTLRITSDLATAYLAVGKLDLALPLLQETLERSKATHGVDHPSTLTSMNNLAAGLLAAKKLDLALPLLDETFKLSRTKLGADHPDTLHSMANLAAGYRTAGKFELALPLFEDALKRKRINLGNDHPSTLLTLDSLAECTKAAGQAERSVQLRQEIFELRKARFGLEHPDTLESLNVVAVGLWQLKRLDESVPLFEQVVSISRRALGDDHPDTLRRMANLGINYRDAKRFDEAIPLLERAHEKLRQNPAMDWIGAQLVDTYARAGKKREASTLLVERLQDTRAKVPPESRQLGGLLAGNALALLQLEAYAEAEKLLRECVAIRAKVEPDAWTTFNTQSMLGGALVGQKKYTEAEPLLLAGYEGMKKQEAKIPAQGKVRLTEAEGRLIELFEATREKTETKLQGSLTEAKTEVGHELKLTAGRAVVIELRSKQFDTLLRLEDPEGKLIAENDDIDIAAKNLNSRVWFMPKADGLYRIVATSFQQTGRGEYQVSIKEFAGKKEK
jgi:tetratricopeptide (TPR) repeat protein